MLRECPTEGVCGLYGGFADTEVERVGEEGVELQPQEPSFREKRTVLLDDGEEMRDELWIRDYDRLSEQRPAFGSAYTERVAEAGEIGKRYVILR